ncbi:SMC-Scp complex subunit ScpB [Rhodopirellula europaea]|uniref:Prokaryotic chromosome segregation and condensation protein ScpB n=1 Tax=Rhodopirellula europaea 6C TaxID=1263867 RepID=M2AJB9_9BACT|nr:SMC-Scp complex subunit ScpB [Rhodopirellula europaea]EMB17240.1 Prokaryotic chromosome segregation and condensation protein ScpB [Rhodopirellula europaea 6C]
MNGYATPWASGRTIANAMRPASVAEFWSAPTQGQLTPEQRSSAARNRLLAANSLSTGSQSNHGNPHQVVGSDDVATSGIDSTQTDEPVDGRESTGSDTGESFDPEDRAAARARIEAVLLIAKSPLNYRRLAALADVEDATSARTLVGELNELYERLGRGIRIEQVAGGQRMMTRSVVAPWLRRLGFLAPAIRLSWPMMETLAVVAYRQDVTRADVEAVRGVACGEILRQLMQLDLVRISGRSEELGRPYLYGTTKRFLKICGLASIKSLPPIDWHASCDDVSQSADGEVENIADELNSRDPSQTESHPRRESSDSETSDTNPSETEHLHPTKESDVSVAAIETLATEFTASLDADQSGAVAVLDAPASDADAASSNDPSAVIEDEEDDLYENGYELDDDEDDDFDDDDWDDDDEDSDDEDDDEDEDEDDDDEDLDDSDDDDDDLDGTDDWEEVDDDEADEDWDDEDEEDDLDEEEEEWED